MECEYGNYEKYNHQFNIPYGTLPDAAEVLEMFDWCTDQFGVENFHLLYRTLYFVNECDYTWFIMRWS